MVKLFAADGEEQEQGERRDRGAVGGEDVSRSVVSFALPARAPLRFDRPGIAEARRVVTGLRGGARGLRSARRRATMRRRGCAPRCRRGRGPPPRHCRADTPGLGRRASVPPARPSDIGLHAAPRVERAPPPETRSSCALHAGPGLRDDEDVAHRHRHAFEHAPQEIVGRVRAADAVKRAAHAAVPHRRALAGEVRQEERAIDAQRQPADALDRVARAARERERCRGTTARNRRPPASGRRSGARPRSRRATEARHDHRRVGDEPDRFRRARDVVGLTGPAPRRTPTAEAQVSIAPANTGTPASRAIACTAPTSHHGASARPRFAGQPAAREVLAARRRASMRASAPVDGARSTRGAPARSNAVTPPGISRATCAARRSRNRIAGPSGRRLRSSSTCVRVSPQMHTPITRLARGASRSTRDVALRSARHQSSGSNSDHPGRGSRAASGIAPAAATRPRGLTSAARNEPAPTSIARMSCRGIAAL